jgi:hypothetical protein
MRRPRRGKRLPAYRVVSAFSRLLDAVTPRLENDWHGGEILRAIRRAGEELLEDAEGWVPAPEPRNGALNTRTDAPVVAGNGANSHERPGPLPPTGKTNLSQIRRPEMRVLQMLDKWARDLADAGHDGDVVLTLPPRLFREALGEAQHLRRYDLRQLPPAFDTMPDSLKFAGPTGWVTAVADE